MHGFQHVVGNVQPQAPLWIGFDDVAKFPTNGIRRNAGHRFATPARRNDTLHNTAKDAAQTDVHFQHPQFIATANLHGFKCDVGHPDHFTTVDINDLLIEKVAPQAQHIIVAMVRN